MTKSRGTVVGTGMLARACLSSRAASEGGKYIFASGVSNSTSNDEKQFERERTLLLQSLEQCGDTEAFVYFGTCAADVPGNESSPYVLHKLDMEALVLAHPSGHVARLPQVAGPGASPFTLLSVLCSRIKEGLPVVLHERATRNIIDVHDVVLLMDAWLVEPGHPRLINIANTRSYSILSIVDTIETVLGTRAIRELLPSGLPYEVDTTAMQRFLDALGVVFDDHYLASVVKRYYS